MWEKKTCSGHLGKTQISGTISPPGGKVFQIDLGREPADPEHCKRKPSCNFNRREQSAEKLRAEPESLFFAAALSRVDFQCFLTFTCLDVRYGL